MLHPPVAVAKGSREREWVFSRHLLTDSDEVGGSWDRPLGKNQISHFHFKEWDDPDSYCNLREKKINILHKQNGTIVIVTIRILQASIDCLHACYPLWGLSVATLTSSLGCPSLACSLLLGHSTAGCQGTVTNLNISSEQNAIRKIKCPTESAAASIVLGDP